MTINPPNKSRLGDALFWLALAAILVAATYMRLDRLGSIQHFKGDQGRDYVVIMDWIQRGEWPLLGQMRGVGDHSIGPGWFYVLLAPLALSGFHPVAGAAMIALAGVAMIALTAMWIREATGTRLAALATALVFMGPVSWVEHDRILWNPHLVPAATLALAWLMAIMPRHPVRALTASFFLMAIMPHWHTTGLLVNMAAAPCLVMRTLQTRREWPPVTRRKWLAASALYGVWLVALYLPPILYELKPGPGNIVAFIKNTAMNDGAVAPWAPTAGERLGYAIERLWARTLGDSFANTPLDHAPGLWLAGVFSAALTLAAALAAFRRRMALLHRIDWAAVYLALIYCGYFLILALKGERIYNYFLQPVLPVPVVLAGWAAGSLAAFRAGEPWRRRWPAPAGWAMAAAMIVFGCISVPGGWGIHRGEIWHGHAFRDSRKIARRIEEMTQGRPYSLLMIENGHYEFRAHMIALLRRDGAAPVNEDLYRAYWVEPDEFGEELIILSCQKSKNLRAETEGLTGPLPPTETLRYARIWRVPAGLLPEPFNKLHLTIGKRRFYIHAE